MRRSDGHGANADDRERLAGGTGRQYRRFDVSNQLHRDNLRAPVWVCPNPRIGRTIAERRSMGHLILMGNGPWERFWKFEHEAKKSAPRFDESFGLVAEMVRELY